MNVAAAMMLKPEIRAIGGAFSLVEIIGEAAPPAVPEAKARHAAAGKKLKEGQRLRQARRRKSAPRFSGRFRPPSRRSPLCVDRFGEQPEG